LTVQHGATSYANLRTIRGTEYATYQQASLALGLLEDNWEWIQCFQETVVYATGAALRTLFATAIMYSNIHDPHDLWLRFRQHFCDDLPHQLQQLTFVIPPDLVDPHFDYGLHLLSIILEDAGKLLDTYHLPPVLGPWKEIIHVNALIATQLMYQPESEEDNSVIYSAQLNPG